MAELLALFRFLAPYFAGVPDSDVEQALTLAEAARPDCLSGPKQDAAQVYYAAALLYDRKLQQDAVNAPAIPLGVTSEKEGDLQRSYGHVEGSEDPFDFAGQYRRLAAQCVGGAITVGIRWPVCCPPAYLPRCGC